MHSCGRGNGGNGFVKGIARINARSVELGSSSSRLCNERRTGMEETPGENERHLILQ